MIRLRPVPGREWLADVWQEREGGPARLIGRVRTTGRRVYVRLQGEDAETWSFPGLREALRYMLFGLTDRSARRCLDPYSRAGDGAPVIRLEELDDGTGEA